MRVQRLQVKDKSEALWIGDGLIAALIFPPILCRGNVSLRDSGALHEY